MAQQTYQAWSALRPNNPNDAVSAASQPSIHGPPLEGGALTPATTPAPATQPSAPRQHYGPQQHLMFPPGSNFERLQSLGASLEAEKLGHLNTQKLLAESQEALSNEQLRRETAEQALYGVQVNYGTLLDNYNTQAEALSYNRTELHRFARDASVMHEENRRLLNQLYCLRRSQGPLAAGGPSPMRPVPKPAWPEMCQETGVARAKTRASDKHLARVSKNRTSEPRSIPRSPPAAMRALADKPISGTFFAGTPSDAGDCKDTTLLGSPGAQ